MPVQMSHEFPIDDNRRMGNSEAEIKSYSEMVDGCATWAIGTIIVLVIVFLLYGECKHTKTNPLDSDITAASTLGEKTVFISR